MSRKEPSPPPKGAKPEPPPPPPPIPTARFDPSTVRTRAEARREKIRRETATAILAGIYANSATAHVRAAVAVDEAIQAADLLLERLEDDQ